MLASVAQAQENRLHPIVRRDSFMCRSPLLLGGAKCRCLRMEMYDGGRCCRRVGETEEGKNCYDVESIQVREQARVAGSCRGNGCSIDANHGGRAKRRIIDACMEKRIDRNAWMVRQADREIKTDWTD